MRWEAHQFYQGGAAPTAEMIAAAKKDQYGIAQLDSSSASWKEIADQSDPLPPDLSRIPMSLQGQVSATYWNGTDSSTAPLFVESANGNRVVTLSLVSDSDDETLALNSWDLASTQIHLRRCH